MSQRGSGRSQGTPAADRSDAALDAVLSAADVAMLAAVRRGLDLDGGLADIIGSPPRRDPHTSELPAER
jgi:hypothetical protein